MLIFSVHVKIKAYLCIYICPYTDLYSSYKYARNHRYHTGLAVCLVICSWNQEISGTILEKGQGKNLCRSFYKVENISGGSGKHRPTGLHRCSLGSRGDGGGCLQEQKSEELAEALLKAEDVNAVELWDRRRKVPRCSENDPNKYG